MSQLPEAITEAGAHQSVSPRGAQQARRGGLLGVRGTLLVVRRIHYPTGREALRSQTRVLADDPIGRHRVLRAVRLQLLRYLFPDRCAFALSISYGRRFSEAES